MVFVDVRFVAYRDKLGETDSFPGGIFKSRDPDGAALGNEGDLALSGKAARKGRVQETAGSVLMTRNSSARPRPSRSFERSPAADAPARCPAADFLETGADDDRSLASFAPHVFQDLRDHARRDQDDREIHIIGHIQHRRVGADAQDVLRLGVDRIHAAVVSGKEQVGEHGAAQALWLGRRADYGYGTRCENRFELF